MTDKKNKNRGPDKPPASGEPDELSTVAALGLHPVDNKDLVISVIPGKQKLDGKDDAKSGKKGDKNLEPNKNMRGAPDLRLRGNLKQPPIYEAPSSGWINIIIISFMLLWLITAGLISYEFLDLAHLDSHNVWQLLGIAMLFLVPLLAILLMGYGLKRLDEMSQQSERLSRTAQYLTQIDEHLAGHTADLARNIVGEIQRMEDSLEQTALRVQTLKNRLNAETSKLEASGKQFDKRADRIEQTFARERGALQKTADEFDARVTKLAKSLTQQTGELNTSSKQAEKRIETAQQGFQAATMKVNSAADIIKAYSADAADEINIKHIQLKDLSADMRAQFEALSKTYEQQVEKTKSLMRSLRLEHEELNAQAELHRQTLKASTMQASAAPAAPANLSEPAPQKASGDLPPALQIIGPELLVGDGQDQTDSPADADNSEGFWKTSPSVKSRQASQEHRKLNLRPALEPESPAFTERADAQPGIYNAIAPPIQDSPGQDNPGHDSPGDIKSSHNLEGNILDGPRRGRDIEIYQDELPLGHPQNGAASTARSLPDDNQDDNLVRRPFEDQEPEAQSSWWRNLLGMRPARSSDYAINMLVGNSGQPEADPIRTEGQTDTRRLDQSGLAPQPASLQPVSDASVSEASVSEALISQLSAIGLTPSVIIDDGCIEDAVNMRIQHGSKAMSLTTARRLDEPVRFLRENLAANAQLKEEAVQFASRFHNALSGVSGDEISLRQRFQSDDGRAFLLCDAAMNGS